jgi:hypothetical protein
MIMMTALTGREGVGELAGERRRRSEWSMQKPGPGATGPPNWDEVPSRDPDYDPTAAQPSRYWDDGSGVPQANPYQQVATEGRYSYQPPPPMYAQSLPPMYANPYGYPPPYMKPTSPGLAIAGGALSIIAGVVGILGSIFWFGDALLWELGLAFCWVIMLVVSIIAIIGGIMALARRMFPMAIIGAVCAMLSVGFFGLSFFLGLVALILIILGKDTFGPMAPRPDPYRY